MTWPRRQMLKVSTLAIGASVFPAPGSGAASRVQSAGHEASGGTTMEKVLGIGGLFFRAHDPKLLAKWYQQHLGISPTPAKQDDPVWQQEAGKTVFAPFPEKSDYFGDPQKGWMVNFRVHDLEKMAKQLTDAGIAVKMYPPDPSGLFARLHDPEGNPIELWQDLEPKSKS